MPREKKIYCSYRSGGGTARFLRVCWPTFRDSPFKGVCSPCFSWQRRWQMLKDELNELKHRRHELRKEIKADIMCMEQHKQFTSHASENKDSSAFIVRAHGQGVASQR